MSPHVHRVTPGWPIRAFGALPKGRTLPPESWSRRHVGLCLLLWAHVPAIYAFALTQGKGAGHALLDTGAVVVLATAASWLPRSHPRASSCLLAFGLLTCSAVITHLSGGHVEAHFHFFVVVTLLVLYEDWLPFLLAIAFVAVHHGVGGALMPESMYNHPDGIAHPWKWAGIHAGFIAALSAGSILSWRLNEDGREEARLAHDATEQALESARLSSERFENAFVHAPIGMALLGLDGRFLKVNGALCSLLGQAEPDLLERTLQDVTHPDDLAADARSAAEVVAGTRDSYEVEKRYLDASGRARWALSSVSLVRDKDAQPLHFVAQVIDIADRKRAEVDLRHLADHDALTGLWNRRRFEEELGAALGRGKRYGGSAALLVLDLDRFKSINDAHGHRAGDEALRHVARALLGRLRTTDSVGRLGGDEFAVLMAQLPTEGAEEVAASLVAAIQDTGFAFAGHEIHVGASVGLTFLPVDSLDTVDEAMSRADTGLYAAKAGSGPHREPRAAVRIVAGHRMAPPVPLR